MLYLYGEEITGRRAREIHTLNRCLSLCRAGVNVHLIIAESPSFSTDESLLGAFGLSSHSNLSIVHQPRQWKLGPFSLTSSNHYYSRVHHWLSRAGHFDLAYVIHLKAALFLQQYSNLFPVIFEAHEIFADAYPEHTSKYRTLSRREALVYAGLEGLVGTSEYLLAELQRRYKTPDAAFVSPNCVDESFFSTAPGLSDPKELIYVGSFQAWKGVSTAIEAMRRLTGYHLTVVGGSDRQVHELSATAPSNITFTGFLPKEKILPLLARASIGLLPNRLEPKNSLYTFPMKFLEYAAANKKVVATDLPVLRELKPGAWVELVPPDDPDALAKAVHSLSARLDDNAPRNWALGYRWDRRTAELIPFLELICRRA
jgi:glycosyltransferase involved in cell wall biosynthesis